MKFILKQIKIAEHHAISETDPDGNPLLGPGQYQVGNALLPFGLRTVDGSYNNLIPGQAGFGATKQLMPRHADPQWRAADDGTAFGVPGQTNYGNKNSHVVDSHPRIVSNLVVDQTASNPAAVAAAAVPHRHFRPEASAIPCVTEDPLNPLNNLPAGCTPKGETLFIPNVTTDVGLSPPFNSWFTIFGQFFDHGLDLTAKKGKMVFVPLKADDPLVLGKDGTPNTADDLPPQLRVMMLTRAKNDDGPDNILGNADDIQEATNLDSSWVDQSQTYTSHESHQVFLRQYSMNDAGKPMETGKMVEGDLPSGGVGGMATWAKVKEQTEQMLGFVLSDQDALNIPHVLANQYGRFLRGPNGYPQLMTATGLVEGNPDNPVPVPANVERIDIAFLDDIAHAAAPVNSQGNPLTADGDGDTGNAQVPGAGTYDNELLDSHFIAGDGRVNENIALTAIHQVFHSEHNRLVGHMQNLINSSGDAAFIDEWKLAADASWNGDRLLQAARFVTEMEYQHLVFEEFARKVEPGIPPFNVFTQSMTDINSTIHAEFAHAVYRFGHSLLTDTVARRNTDGSDNSLPLLTAFLNPPSYYNKGGGAFYSPEEAAGAIAQGMTDQVANELDEFVAETLRSNLLGLPLDLPTINMARAREAGIPSLNRFRRQIWTETNDSSMQPYTSWVDYALGLKHEKSVINYMAAYGTHPTILFADGVSTPPTLASRRAAATALYEQGVGAPADAADFVNSTGAWATNPVNALAQPTKTGVDDVDLWVGGLGEMQNLFGGLLGSSFHHVFEAQMSALQDGDRLYYLSRTSGLNLRTQLEGNSFAELVMRNTTATALKADAFDTADCEFDLNQPNFIGEGNNIANDPLSECDEDKVLIRLGDGTIAYRVSNSVDPPGINAQNIFNGTSGPDKVRGGVDLDTFWGNEGDDTFEGNDGGDLALGGEGDDVITDSAGSDDVLKGGPGSDAIDAGPGLDVIMSGPGKDFTNGGSEGNQHFLDEGDDFVISGAGQDEVFGGGGDDWQEGGGTNDLLQGDNGAPFFDDINAPGDDVLIGGSGEDDYDAEGGHDIMVAGSGIERNHGARGFDWAIHDGSPEPGDSDLTINIINAPIQLADRFLMVEGLSGAEKDDVLKGDDWIPFEQDVELHAPWGSNMLPNATIDAIPGLAPIFGDSNPTDAAGHLKCRTDPQLPGHEGEVPPAEGPPITLCGFGSGNILLGGAGSDTIQGRGTDDVIDGDRWLNVKLRAWDKGANNGAGGVVYAESLEELQNRVFTRQIDIRSIEIVREVLNPGAGNDIDTAVYKSACKGTAAECQTAGVQADYDITRNPDGSVTVFHARNLPDLLNDQGAPKGDGTDTLWNIERLQFNDGIVSLVAAVAPGAPGIGAATAGANFSATVNWTPPAGNLVFPITGYQVQLTDNAGNPVGAVRDAGANATSLLVTGLTGGSVYRFKVAAVNSQGTSAYSALSNAVTISSDNTPPTIVSRVPGPGATGFPINGNLTVTLSEAVQGVNGVTVYVRRTSPAQPPIAAVITNVNGVVTIDPNNDLTANATYQVTLLGGPLGIRDLSNPANPLALLTQWSFTVAPAAVPPVQPPAAPAVPPATPAVPPAGPAAPTAPRIAPAAPLKLRVSRGARGRPLTVTVRWAAPRAEDAVTGYVVTALRMRSTAPKARVLRRIVTSAPASARAKVMTLRAGMYRFTVTAVNAYGKSADSRRTNVVAPR